MSIKMEVLCINKSKVEIVNERIISFNAKSKVGVVIEFTQAEAIADIESEKYEFFFTKSGYQISLVVALSSMNFKYLRSNGGGDRPNTLLELPQCIENSKKAI